MASQSDDTDPLSEALRAALARIAELEACAAKHPGDFIREETKPAYQDFGSLEGTLNAIQDGAGGLELCIKDPLWLRPIKCFLAEDMLSSAMGYFCKRVELYGEIHYRKDDTPESIRVERLEPLVNDDDLPGLREMRGLFAVGAA